MKKVLENDNKSKKSLSSQILHGVKLAVLIILVCLFMFLIYIFLLGLPLLTDPHLREFYGFAVILVIPAILLVGGAIFVLVYLDRKSSDDFKG